MSLATTRVGSLYGDLTSVATAVQRSCIGTSMVWADDIGGIHVVPPARSGISPHNIVGIFTLGVSLADIRDDLEAMRRERARYWIAE